MTRGFHHAQYIATARSSAPGESLANHDPELTLTKGSKYRVESLESREKTIVSHGEFLGFTMMGNIDGIALRLDKSHADMAGKVRIIPSHMVVSLDVIEAKKEEPEKEKKTSDPHFYQ
ncbi:MAG TPA: hypothetical protein VJ547_05835 [Candidatus Thermoplasmatota archaeon]|nr:hypothetical protein [Candidatus Thermoplasmatota archaeon]